MESGRACDGIDRGTISLSRLEEMMQLWPSHHHQTTDHVQTRGVDSHSDGPFEAKKMNVALSALEDTRLHCGTSKCDRASTTKAFLSSGIASCLRHTTVARTVPLAEGGRLSTWMTMRWFPADHITPFASGSRAGHPAVEDDDTCPPTLTTPRRTLQRSIPERVRLWRC